MILEMITIDNNAWILENLKNWGSCMTQSRHRWLMPVTAYIEAKRCLILGFITIDGIRYLLYGVNGLCNPSNNYCFSNKIGEE